MKFNIYGKNVSVTDAMRDRIEKKLSFLEKYFLIDEDTTANVVVKVYPIYQKIEVTIPVKLGLLRAEATHEDFYSAIDIAIDKLEDQIRRQKTRLSKKHRDKLALAFIDEGERVEDYVAEDDVVVRTKRIHPEVMDMEEAILQMEMLGHSFFIYCDSETENIALVYKRNDGGYGLLETI